MRKSKLRTVNQLREPSGGNLQVVAALFEVLAGSDEAVGRPIAPDRNLGEFLLAHKLLRAAQHVFKEHPLIAQALSQCPGATSGSIQAPQAFHDEYDRVASILAAQSIPCCAMKGIYFGRQCYPDKDCRPMQDVDVLVPEAMLDTAVRCLLATGYRVVEEQERQGPSKNLHYDQLVHPDRGIPLEVHHRVARRLTYNAIDGADLNKGNHHFGLSRELHALIKAVDVAKDGYFKVGLLSYLDLYLALKGLGKEAVREMVEFSRTMGVAHFFVNALVNLRAVLGCLSVRVPAVLETVTSNSYRMRALNALYAEGGRSILTIKYTPRWQRRVIAKLVGTVG